MGRELNVFDVIRRPVITEKSQLQQDDLNVYVFEVDLNATKAQIVDAVQYIFSVDVIKVRTAIMPAKRSRSRLTREMRLRTKMWKKAYVTVEPGQNIDLFGI